MFKVVEFFTSSGREWYFFSQSIPEFNSKRRGASSEQFKSVFTLEDENLLPPSKPSYPPCPSITVHPAGIAELLKNLQAHKTPGPDSISNLVLKNCSDSIAPLLTLVFQRSQDIGVGV